MVITMKTIYEQGDIVINHNNRTFGFVLMDYFVMDEPKKETVVILELTDEVKVNFVPRGALEYKGKCCLKKELLSIIEERRSINES